MGEGVEAVYRVFEALDELGAILEEARSVPMTAGCLVPRGDVLELLDDIRDAFPADLDDAQDVLDQKDRLIGEARSHYDTTVTQANSEADATLSRSRAEADRLLADAKAQADRMVAEAHQHATGMVAEARAEDERIRRGAQREYEAVTGRARAEAERLVADGNTAYQRSVAEGISEQERLVAETEVVAAAKAESDRIIDAAHAESDRLRGECDVYVDTKLAQFEEVLGATMRSVNRGRQQLRTASGVHDYSDHGAADEYLEEFAETHADAR